MEIKEFGIRLRKYRGKTSQEKFCELLGYGQTYISSLEKGLSTPSIELLDKLVKMTQITSAYWLGEIDEAISPNDLINTTKNDEVNISATTENNVNDKRISVLDMELDSLSSFLRDRVKYEINDTKDSTIKRVQEDVEALLIFLKKYQRDVT
ncbi:MAG: helix-turn-helix transcriptional regulator [bacterium]|nr:helix-turn-helix transcriptional regulator [bacterium]